MLNLDHGYVGDPSRFEWTQGAVAAVRAVNDAGLLAFVVTNQSGVARGLYGEAEVEALHAWMRAELGRAGARLDDVRYCPHHPEGTVAAYARACRDRKPGPGMIEDLARRWPVDLPASLIVGDNPSDLEAGRAAGVGAGLLFEGGDLLAALQPWLRTSR